MTLIEPDRRWRQCCQAALISVLLLCGLRSAVGADLYDIEAATPARVLRADFFATHLHRLVPVDEPNARTTPWPAAPIAGLRLWDSTTRWADLEPASGAFRFERLDAYVSQARAHGASLLMVLGSPPRWASARPDEPGPYGPGSAAEPKRLEDWDRYVAALARRYKGRIGEYELWNEPYFSDLPADRGHPGAFFTGSTATMVELARRARAVLDREDPRAVLLTPGFVGGVQRLDMFLGAGGGRHVSGVAYHYYASDEREFIKLHRDIRDVMVRHHLSPLPLYNTESGFAADENGARASAAAMLARSIVLAAFLGVDRFYQYAWDNTRSGMLLPRSHDTAPSAHAFDAVQRWLVGTTLQGCRLQADDSVRCEGTRASDRLSIWWKAAGARASALVLPANLRLISAEHAVDKGQAIDLVAARTRGIVVGIDPLAVWWRPAGNSEGAGQ